MARAPFVSRVGRVPEALARLALHPAGLRLADLAAELGVPEAELREDLLAFYVADPGSDDSPWSLDLAPPELTFLADDGSEDDPQTAQVVRVGATSPAAELGVDALTAAELSTLYGAAQRLAALDPSDTDLRSALEVLETAFLPGLDAEPYDPELALAAVLRTAAREQRRVRVRYARAWRPGTTERVVEPYRLVSTRRGWELDAGPLDADGEARTYLLSGVLSAEVLEEDFAREPAVEAAIERSRRPTPVELVVPQPVRWAVDRFAERVEVLAEDEESVSLRAWLLPPVPARLGLLLLVAGPDAFVVSPAELTDAGRDTARELLDHHRLSG